MICPVGQMLVKDRQLNSILEMKNIYREKLKQILVQDHLLPFNSVKGYGLKEKLKHSQVT